MTNPIVPSITDEQLAELEAALLDADDDYPLKNLWMALVNRLRVAESEVLRSQQANWQAECIKKGFEYVREPDDHYVVADPAEMVSLLRDLLGIDVRQKDGSDYGVSVAELEQQVDGLVNTIHTLEQFRKDAEHYRWLRSLKCNQWILSRDEAHASNYVTAKRWIEDFCPEEFQDCDPEELERMKQANTIWKLQIYPRTPIGFNDYHAATLDDVVKAAMEDQE